MVGAGKNARRISIRAVHRDPPDVHRLAQVFLELARQQAEDERKRLDWR
jgi:hypothetical protein